MVWCQRGPQQRRTKSTTRQSTHAAQTQQRPQQVCLNDSVLGGCTPRTCLVTRVPPSILAASPGASSALQMCTPPCRWE